MSCNCDQILAGLNQIQKRQEQNYPYLKKEIQKLIKRVQELEANQNSDGLTPKEQGEVEKIFKSGTPAIAASAGVILFPTLKAQLTPPLLEAQSDNIEKLADARFKKMLDARLKPINKSINGINKSVNGVKSSVKGLGARITANGQKIVKNSRTLTKVSNVANKAAKTAGTLFNRLAPIFGIVGFLLNLASAGMTAIALAKLFSRMSAQEKLMAALRAGLTFAGGQLLTAAYVSALNRKVVGIEAQQKVDTRRIIGHVTGEHGKTRTQVQRNRSVTEFQNQRTRFESSANTQRTIGAIGNNREANAFEHRTTRERISATGQSIKQTVTQSAAKTQSLLGNYYRNIMAAIAGIGSGIATQVNALVSPQLQAILDVANDTRNKLIDKFQKTWDFLKMDRVLSILSTGASIHNAAMLSRNLTASLIDSISGTLSIIGLKDAEGNPFDLSSILGSSIQSFVVGVIGQDAYNNLSDTWIKSNRIISAGVNVIMAVRSAQWSIAEGIEIIGGWIAKIGNGLRDGGTVSDRQWPWMKEGIKIKQFSRLEKFNQGLESAEEITNQVYGTVAAGVEIGETVNSVRTAKDQFDQTLEQETTTADTEFDQRTSESESPDIDPIDLVKIEE